MPDKNVIDGKIKQAEGVVQETVGELTHNDKLKAQGLANKAAGKAQETVGHLRDAVQSATPKP